MSRAKFKEARLTVEGRGPFPVDMLRYDSCCPATGEDAAQIERSGWSKPRLSEEPRRIKLRRFYEPGAPPGGTPARWSSFLWAVVAVEEVR